MLVCCKVGRHRPVVPGGHLLPQLLNVTATFLNLHHLHPLHWEERQRNYKKERTKKTVCVCVGGGDQEKTLLLKNRRETENVLVENQSKNELNSHTQRQAKDIMVKLLKLPVTIGFTGGGFSWHSASFQQNRSFTWST